MSNETMSELKPCPFCGGEVGICGGTFECRSCGVEVRFYSGEDVEEQFNHRNPDPIIGGEDFLNWLCGKKGYSIIRGEMYSKDQLRLKLKPDPIIGGASVDLCDIVTAMTRNFSGHHMPKLDELYEAAGAVRNLFESDPIIGELVEALERHHNRYPKPKKYCPTCALIRMAKGLAGKV